MEYQIVPSFPAPGWSTLQSMLDTLQSYCSEFQVDLVDGTFASPASWPFTTQAGIADIHKLTPYTKQFALELDCMIDRPEQYLSLFTSLGIARLVIHYGSTKEWSQLRRMTQQAGIQLGVGVMPSVDLAVFPDLLPHIDYVQVMGISVIGKQGQPLAEEALLTIEHIAATYPGLEIAVDGSVNEATIVRFKEAGANRFAPGSAITQASDPVVAYKHLEELITNHRVV